MLDQAADIALSALKVPVVLITLLTITAYSILANDKNLPCIQKQHSPPKS
jgi:hypothetical protein